MQTPDTQNQHQNQKKSDPQIHNITKSSLKPQINQNKFLKIYSQQTLTSQTLAISHAHAIINQLVDTKTRDTKKIPQTCSTPTLDKKKLHHSKPTTPTPN
ncbi:hypothetical protein KC19_2G120700 [Ceratodon purpureus]|uniref:Uncharacterized protein n=1 Tax=Ceratodon purpureus TaxID=3225 RepID=A0A8T0IVX7_CERPU|nr:hypothetical protein KC19_2G120700 [Ceratodon purpureus]